MEEGIKDRIILILAILTIIFFIIAVGSCNASRIQRKLKDQEISSRMDLEANLAKFTQEKANLEDTIKKCQKALEEEKATLESTKDALLQEQLINKSLKDELQKLTKLKETLEEDLKEALVGRSSKEGRK